MAVDPDMDARFELDRFVRAQRHSYDAALAELRRGAKTSHWMWYVFPQLSGLGHSDMARAYAISNAEEARAYWVHPVLGPRLLACIAALDAVTDRSAAQVFGTVDAMKLRSSLTLFEAATGEPVFTEALARWCGGDRDARTLALLRDGPAVDS